MAAPRTTRKLRRPKPVNYGTRRALRFGEAEEAAVAAMRAALAKSRRVDPSQVSFSEAHRLLLIDAERAARLLAGQPEAWTSARTVEVPMELWDGLSECRNRLSHSQGSLYVILRKLNFNEGATPEDVRAAFAAVQSSKAAVERMEAALVEMLGTLEAEADAEADDEVS
ncbi:hypothetical protein QFZ53_002800 [Microbacterium natoriense]|uniref:SAV-6107-like HEPN domain-containing protein n=1 Tax=Microbacterium natoriense TaxID=284570 RepID=A0AAW8F0N6_9MICO|nr:hypothetical protein [Microbacterium natoriense]MDQ0648604.1 hypothetical protein [Microbacterium natoriense]